MTLPWSFWGLWSTHWIIDHVERFPLSNCFQCAVFVPMCVNGNGQIFMKHYAPVTKIRNPHLWVNWGLFDITKHTDLCLQQPCVWRKATVRVILMLTLRYIGNKGSGLLHYLVSIKSLKLEYLIINNIKKNTIFWLLSLYKYIFLA